MKKLSLLVLTMMIAGSAFAQMRPWPGSGFPGGPGGGFHGGPGGFGERDGKRFKPVVPEICGVTDVKIQVEGDDANINGVSVLTAYGYLPVQVRPYIRRGEGSMWKPIDPRGVCVTGVYLDAYTNVDWDSDSSVIHFWGAQNVGRGQKVTVRLATIHLKDWNGWRRSGGWRPGGPGRR